MAGQLAYAYESASENFDSLFHEDMHMRGARGQIQESPRRKDEQKLAERTEGTFEMRLEKVGDDDQHQNDYFILARFEMPEPQVLRFCRGRLR